VEAHRGYLSVTLHDPERRPAIEAVLRRRGIGFGNVYPGAMSKQPGAEGHLAAAVGAPTLALFGPTDPAVWGPRGKRIATLGGPHAGGFESISVEGVLAELQPWLTT